MTNFGAPEIGATLEEEEDWMRLDEDVKPPGILPEPKLKRGRGKLIMLEDLLKAKEKREKELLQEKNIKRLKKLTKLKKSRDLKGLQEENSESSEDGDSDGSVDTIERNKRSRIEGYLDVEINLIKNVIIGLPRAWGEKVFGPQKPFPDLTVLENDTGLIARASAFSDAGVTGRISLAESMALNGLLRSWAIMEGRCDKATTQWIFQQMTYTKNLSLGKAVCKMLCDLLVLETKNGRPLCSFEWLPNLEDIVDTFRIYGYVEACDGNDPEMTESVPQTVDVPDEGEDNLTHPAGGNERDEPPSNIRYLLLFLVPYFQKRSWYNTLSTVHDAEALAVILARCQLDRRLLCISNLLHRSLEALINCFTEQEWASSCEQIALSISRVSSTFVNNLQVAKRLQATDSRFGSLQRLVVLRLLSNCVESKAAFSSPEEVVSIFKSINIKGDLCNFVNLYYLLVLADIYLWSEPTEKKSRNVVLVWLELLKKYSSQISTGNIRPYAAKVRNWASFLYQKYEVEKLHTELDIDQEC